MKRLYVSLALLTATNGALYAQSSYSANPRGKTTVSKSEYATGYGSGHKKPRNYDAYYYSNVNGYVLSPYLLTTPQYMPKALTPARPYTDIEYGRVVETFVNAGNVAAAGMSSSEIESVVQPSGDQLFGSTGFRPVETQIMDVLDRGHMMVSSREEVRLRGVRIGSERSADDVTRVYAREAMQKLRELTQNGQVSLVIDTPVRDSDGIILVVAKLKDGRDLNQIILQEGLGRLRDTDFPPDVNFDALKDAEREAREKKRGIWSRDIVKLPEQ